MLISLIRAVVLYLALILVVRLMGKRQLGEMEPMEFVVTMLIANQLRTTFLILTLRILTDTVTMMRVVIRLNVFLRQYSDVKML